MSDSWNLKNDTHDILVTYYEDVARVGHVREDATRELLPWNLGFIQLPSVFSLSAGK